MTYKPLVHFRFVFFRVGILAMKVSIAFSCLTYSSSPEQRALVSTAVDCDITVISLVDYFPFVCPVYH